MFSAVLLLTSLLPAASADVEIVPISHASLILQWENSVIHVDPVSRGNYEGQPKADIILLTDVHGDHLDLKQIDAVSKEDTVIVAPLTVQETVTAAEVLRNGETTSIGDIEIEALPMYNLKRGPSPGRLYHVKGRGNGYVITFGETRVYISGDTACIPEMKALRNIDIAFLCMNLPYTMSPDEAGECVNAFQPSVVYPYHHRGSDLEAFKKAVTAPGVEVKILNWYPE
jgi:L-ascorbate metabolism protein UlaG (beta-lactamase superfamily)